MQVGKTDLPVRSSHFLNLFFLRATAYQAEKKKPMHVNTLKNVASWLSENTVAGFLQDVVGTGHAYGSQS